MSLGSQISSLPIIQHFTGLVQRKLPRIEQNRNKNAQPDARDEKGLPMPQRSKVPQSTTFLPLEYQTLLSLQNLTKQAAHDPLLALIPIFKHSACSEVQFLNLLESCIDAEVPHLEPERIHHASLENMQYFAHLLRGHATQIRQCVRSVQILSPGHWGGFQSSSSRYSQRGSVDKDDRHSEGTWDSSRGAGSDERHEVAAWEIALNRHAESPAVSLLEDYEDLLARCSDLSARCTSAMEVTMNKALVLESQKAIEQSERLKKLSLLATFFIPLSFTSSLFGMNFQVFGQGELSVWLYAAVALPVTVVPFLFYVCDITQMGQSTWRWAMGRLQRAERSPELAA